MLPNLYWPTIILGPVTIQVWGLCVAAGMLAAIYVARWFAQRTQLQPAIILDASFWIILVSLVGARLWYVVTDGQWMHGDVWAAFRFWEGGMAMSGGLLAGIVAGVVYFKIKQVAVWPYVEAFMFALPLGEAIGRLGCFFIFDHPGTVTSFFLGEVYYGDGLVRHNHGLYLAINGAILFLVFLWLVYRTKIKVPMLLVIYLIWNGVVRLVLDQWRITDAHYYGLTAAQWAGLVMIVIGGVIWAQRKKIVKL